MKRLTMPIVSVIGTNTKQGKYTLQLELYRRLTAKGYQTGFLATEPSGYLFNADAVFHFGYNANINIQHWEYIPLINEWLWEMQLQQKDITITGCQSATLHYDGSNVNYFTFAQHNFLLANN